MIHDIQESLFDRPTGIARGIAGMAKAADARPELLALAREVAAEIARNKPTVNSDDVAEVLLSKHGILPVELGNAAGSVFRGDPRFEFTGDYVQARRVQSRGRIIKQWRLK